MKNATLEGMGGEMNTKLTFIPLGDKILVQTTEEEEKKTSLGIIIPKSSPKDPNLMTGSVVSIGDGKLVNGDSVNMRVKEGDTVLFPSWAASKVPQNEKFAFVKVEEIYAIVQGDK